LLEDVAQLFEPALILLDTVREVTALCLPLFNPLD
jgi:hypothetical protein